MRSPSKRTLQKGSTTHHRSTAMKPVTEFVSVGEGHYVPLHRTFEGRRFRYSTLNPIRAGLLTQQEARQLVQEARVRNRSGGGYLYRVIKARGPVYPPTTRGQGRKKSASEGYVIYHARRHSFGGRSRVDLSQVPDYTDAELEALLNE